MIAEKPCHADQQVFIQVVQFVGVLLQPFRVIVQVERMIQQEPPLGSPGDGVWLVVAEIDPVAVAEQTVDRIHCGFAHGIGDRRPLCAFSRRMMNAAQHGPRHFVDGKNEIGDAGFHGALGHAVEFGRFGTLDQDQPARVVDSRIPREPSLPVPDKTIPIAPSPTSWARERKKWSMGSVRACEIFVGQQQRAAGDDHLLLGRNRDRPYPARRPFRPRRGGSGWRSGVPAVRPSDCGSRARGAERRQKPAPSWEAYCRRTAQQPPARPPRPRARRRTAVGSSLGCLRPRPPSEILVRNRARGLAVPVPKTLFGPVLGSGAFRCFRDWIAQRTCFVHVSPSLLRIWREITWWDGPPSPSIFFVDKLGGPSSSSGGHFSPNPKLRTG